MKFATRNDASGTSQTNELNGQMVYWVYSGHMKASALISWSRITRSEHGL